MSGKITLITPPDIYENGNLSILFCHLNEKDQEIVSKWLAAKELTNNINFYVYNGEPNITWLFYAMAVSKHKYLDIDSMNNITSTIASYMLSKNEFFYKTDDENLSAIYSHINTNRITQIEQLLERILSDQNI